MVENFWSLFFAVLVVVFGFLMTMRKDIDFFYDRVTKRMRPAGMALVAVAFVGLLSAAIYTETRWQGRGAKVPDVVAEAAPSVPNDEMGTADRLVIVSPDNPLNAPSLLQLACSKGGIEGDVFFVVKPISVDEFFVQPQDPGWDEGCSGTVHLGRGGTLDIGKTYQVRAIAAPELPLDGNQRLSAWPAAKWRSEILTLVRG